MSSQEIIDAIKEQNRKAERIFYQENRATCISYALSHFFGKDSQNKKIVCTTEDAEELYHDACVLFIQNVLNDRIQYLEAQISTYLITSMRYIWMNKVRATKPTPEIATPATNSEAFKETLRINVRKAIQQLDEKCREMMTYRYILGWEDYDDIAKATGKNNGDVVRNLISRCRKRFRENYIQLTKLKSVR